MHADDWVHIFLFITSFTILTPLLGQYMANVFMGHRTFLEPLLGGIERLSYRIGGINPKQEMHWIEYLRALLVFNLFGLCAVLLLQIFQQWLPLNPQNFPAVPIPTALNTAISFVTNTNWQSYPGETTLSYATQMIGLTVQNFLSAATGCAVLLALIRGLSRKESQTIGNFWEDLTRTVVYILLPLSTVLAIVLVSQGVVQTFSPYASIETLESIKQTIPLGPVASQEAIKQLGTNGGGFFNANSAHPFENPTGLSNFFEMLAMILIPASLTYTFGSMIGSRKHGWFLFILMLVIWALALLISLYSEYLHNPVLDAYPLMEGKETRIGITNSIVWSVTTTTTSNGSINAMLSSLSPIAGGIAMLNIMLGEHIFGGIGVGLSSMIMYILLTIFLAGLMVGRSPEYLGKKIEKKEMKWAILAILIPSMLILIGSGVSSVLPEALSSRSNSGPHGLSEILYAFTSAAGNNGSAFAGLNANTTYYNLALGIVMLIARLAVIVPTLAVAGLLANKKKFPPSAGTLSTNTFLFGLLLGGVILIVGALTFFPSLALGPIVENMLMLEGKSF